MRDFQSEPFELFNEASSESLEAEQAVQDRIKRAKAVLSQITHSSHHDTDNDEDSFYQRNSVSHLPSPHISVPSEQAQRSKKRQKLLAKAVSLLSTREYSEHELRQKLLPLCTEPEDIDAVVQRLKKESWLSDQRFVQSYTNSRRHKWGNQKILHELKQHQLEEPLLEQTREVLKQTEYDRAYAVWEKKFKGQQAQTQQEKAKQMRFLASRGFSAEIVYKIIKNPFDE